MQYSQREVLIKILQQFKLEEPKTIEVLRYEVILPDSFMWRLLIHENIYYLYIEDFFYGFDRIEGIFNDYLSSKDWKLIEVKNPKDNADFRPVLSDSDYVLSGDMKRIIPFTAFDGDYIFLACSNEDVSNARFSEFGPRGFKVG